MNPSQKDLILAHLKKHKSITSWEAIQEYRITRLASVIFLLKQDGYLIYTAKEKSNGKNWTRYILMKGKK